MTPDSSVSTGYPSTKLAGAGANMKSDKIKVKGGQHEKILF
jgi:hypothetical protein